MQYNKKELEKAIEQSHDEVESYLSSHEYIIDIGQPDDDGDIQVTYYDRKIQKNIILGYLKDHDDSYSDDEQEISDRLSVVAEDLIEYNEEAISLQNRLSIIC